jgi:hypothetical protein
MRKKLKMMEIFLGLQKELLSRSKIRISRNITAKKLKLSD